MAILRVDIKVEGEGHLCEHVRAVEFFVRHTKKSAVWSKPQHDHQSPVSVTSSLPRAEARKVAVTSSSWNGVTLDDLTAEERELGPSLVFYAPLGGRLSKEFRALLRQGLVCVLTRLALQLLKETEQGAYACASSFVESGAEGGGFIDNTAGNVSEQYIRVEKDSRGTQVARIHWSTQLLNILLVNVATNLPHFSAQMPRSQTLIPIMECFRSAVVPSMVTAVKDYRSHYHHDDNGEGNNVKGNCDGKTCFLVFTIERMELVQQSVHDERTASRLASILYHHYLKPADLMREAGGESLQAPLPHLHDAMNCYQRALELAQGGLLYPYRHALRPPPSLEDREEDAVEDDIYDEYIAGKNKCDIAPANRYLRVLLLLQKNEENGGGMVESLYNDPSLAGGRAMFPRAHVLFLVWYALHRQVVVAASNAAHTISLIQPATSCEDGWGSKELHKRQIRAAQWCARALSVLHRLQGWWNNTVFREEIEKTDVGREYLWLHTIMFKLLSRRGKLLRVAGALDDCHKAQEEMEEKLRILSTRPILLCRDEIHRLLEDVGVQLSREKSLLRNERKQIDALTLRL